MRRTILFTAIATLTLCFGVLTAEEKPRPGPKTYVGELSKIEKGSLTVTRRGDKGEGSETFGIDDKTKILIETDQDETVKVKKERREVTVTRPKVAEGKAADLKTGRRVTVTYGDDKKATQVVSHRPAKPRKKEGEK